MNSKFAAVTLAAALAVALAIASQGAASGKGNSKSSRDGGPPTKLYAKFAAPASGVILPDEFKSRVKYQRKSNSKGTEEGIEAKVLLAVPADTALDPLVDTTGFLVRILTGTTENRSCALPVKAIELEYQLGVLSEFDLRFAAKVQEKTPIAGPPSTIKNRVGDCWVTTAVFPVLVGRGVPDVALGDTVEVSAITLPVLPLDAVPIPGTLLLSGVFGTAHDHGDDDDDD
jgi:hypothetical protein